MFVLNLEERIFYEIDGSLEQHVLFGKNEFFISQEALSNKLRYFEYNLEEYLKEDSDVWRAVKI